MTMTSGTGPDGTQAAKAPLRIIWRETVAQGVTEVAKRIAQGVIGLTVLIAASIFTLLASAYYLFLEPRLARHVASIITTEHYFPRTTSTIKNTSANPIDDYILKVFLIELSKEKRLRSEYADQISDALKIGDIREGFRIFSRLIGREIDTLDQIKTKYRHPTTVQFMPVNFDTSEKPKYANKTFEVLVRYGQTIELFATRLNIDLLRGNRRDTEVGSVNLMINCGGCRREQLRSSMLETRMISEHRISQKKLIGLPATNLVREQ
jgi:hypothetical protein